jgi:hypothetical protein
VTRTVDEVAHLRVSPRTEPCGQALGAQFERIDRSETHTHEAQLLACRPDATRQLSGRKGRSSNARDRMMQARTIGAMGFTEGLRFEFCRHFGDLGNNLRRSGVPGGGRVW